MPSDFISQSANRNPFPGWVFFTYPQSTTVTKCQIAAEFSALGATSVVVARELHKNGDPHLHACAKLPSGKYSKSKVLKHFQERFPDASKRIDVGRIVKKSTPHHAWAYCVKEDPEPLVVGPAPTDLQTSRYNSLAVELGFPDLAALQAHVADARAYRDKRESALLERCAYIEEHGLVEFLPLRLSHVYAYFNKTYSLDPSVSWIHERDITYFINYDLVSLDPSVNA